MLRLMPMLMLMPISASLVTSSPLPQLPLLLLLLLPLLLLLLLWLLLLLLSLPMLWLSLLALLSQSVSAIRCQWRAPTRLLARFANQLHKRCAPMSRWLCPGKFVRRLLSPSPHLPSRLPALLSLSSVVLALAGLLLEALVVLSGSTRCQRCWLPLKYIYYSQ